MPNPAKQLERHTWAAGCGRLYRRLGRGVGISGQISPRNPLAHEQTEMAAVGRQLAEITRRHTAQSLNSEQLRRRHHARQAENAWDS